ncbi:MAG: DUF4870 domain-containing protein [Tepidisphaeraceae bacterium]
MARRRSSPEALAQDVVSHALRQRQNRGVWIAVALLILVGSAVWSHYRTKPDPAKIDGQDGVVCERVIDGDTVVVNGPGMEHEHLRLRGIDAPEIIHPGLKTNAHFGPEAKRWLAERIEGKPIVLKFDGTEKRDRYQRLLGYIYVDDVCINVELVEKGCAYVNRRFKTMLQANLDTAETQAPNAKSGCGATSKKKTCPPGVRNGWIRKSCRRKIKIAFLPQRRQGWFDHFVSREVDMTEANPVPPSGPTPVNYATPAAGYTGAPATPDEKNMAMLIYLLGIFTGFVGPLILWLMKKEQSAFINDQGKEVLNFQITTFIAWFVCILLMFIVIGVFLMPVVAIGYLVLMIIGLLKAKDGVAYRFPFALRLLK